MKDLPQTATVALPHEADVKFLLDGGIETTLIFHDKLTLPHFAAFVLLETPEGTAVLRRYYQRYLEIAQAKGLGFVLESPTWRANPDWGALLGYDAKDLAGVNAKAIELMRDIRADAEPSDTPVVVSGCIGPRGDGYVVGSEMTAGEAAAYHRPQIEALKAAGAEMCTGLTMTYVSEAVGIARAAKSVGLPVVISFTTETDGHLPNGQTLRDAIAATDAATGERPIYYMINCAHPDHFSGLLEGDWLKRIGGIRANASRMSHAELDESEDLDDGDPEEFGRLYRTLAEILPNVRALGGCCGTDHRHVGAAACAFC